MCGGRRLTPDWWRFPREGEDTRNANHSCSSLAIVGLLDAFLGGES